MKKTKYVAAANAGEAYLRFKAKLYDPSAEECALTAETLTAEDRCEEKCTYDVYEVTVEVKKL